MKNLEFRNLVAIDVETSGLNPHIHDILAVSFVPVDAALPSATFYIKHHQIEWNNFAKENFAKFSNEWDAFARSPIEVCEEIEQYLQSVSDRSSMTPVGHNISFDLAFLRKLAYQGGREQIAGLSHRSVDTHTILFFLKLHTADSSLPLSSDEAFKYFEVEIAENERHTAHGDAVATAELFRHLMQQVQLTIKSKNFP